MIVKLMSLGLDITPDVTKSQEMIESAIEKYLGETAKFAQYNSEKLFITELSNSVKQDDVIVLATETELYIPFKNFISKAFKLNKKYNKHIAKRIKIFHPEIKPDTDTFEAQATIPAGATPLFSNDGLNCGFAIKSNQQVVIVVPFDVDRLDAILNTGVVEYLEQHLPEVVKFKKEQDAKKNPYNEALITETVKKLVAKQIFIALADTNTVDFIGAISNKINDLKRVLTVSDYKMEKGQMPPREYAISLARDSKEASDAPLGACITNVFSVNKEDGSTDMFLYACIADSNQAHAVKLFAKKDEDLPQLIFDAINELFKMLSSWVDTGKVVPPLPEKPKTDKEKEREIKDKKHKTQVKVIVAIMLVLSIVSSFLVAAFVDDIYNIRGTLAEKEQSQIDVDSGKYPKAEQVGADADSNLNSSNDNEHGGLELDSVFIDSVNAKNETTSQTAKTTTQKQTTKPSTQSSTQKTTTTTKEQTTTAAPSGNYPQTLNLAGSAVETPIAIARIVEAEMGSGYHEEALKAQAVAVFSYIKCKNWSTSGLSQKSTYSDKVMKAVNSVLGQVVTYNGRTALTPFFAMSAGKTVASTTVWNTNDKVPYLAGGVLSEEKNNSPSGYKTTKTFSSSELKTMIESKMKITLGSDPSQWIKINAHDSCISADTGYISSMTVGDKTVTGHYFRTTVLEYKIRSQCFNLAYDAGGDTFTFTVYGYGHGVGMSQQGANYYAKQGWNYQKILTYYFPGTQVG